MARGLRIEAFIRLDSGRGMSPELLDRIVRKMQALLKRLGCTAHGTWRLSESDDVEDLLG